MLLSHALRAASKTFRYIGYSGAGNSGTTITYSSQNIGGAAPDRVVFAALWSISLSSRSLSSVTIGGVSATLVVGNASAATRTMYLYMAVVPTGTTADVVATWSGSVSNSGVAIWSAIGYGTVTTKDTDRLQTTAAAKTLTVDTEIDSFSIIAGWQFRGSTITLSSTSSNVTTDLVTTDANAVWFFGSQDPTFTTTETYTITYSNSVSTACPTLAASFN